MADNDLTLIDYIQVDFPDKDYSYSEVEEYREDQNINTLWRHIQQISNIPISAFANNTNATLIQQGAAASTFYYVAS